MNFRVGLGHDTHRLGADRPLILGGVVIPNSPGLIGHSDADVLLHALTDAILGATGHGDIGEWFPDNDPSNKDRDSAEMLRQVVAKCLGPDRRVVNMDAILFAQAPKLTPHKPAIRSRVAELLGISPSRVNIKAKTGELVGPIGRLEAISAEVIILVDMD
jgi:2-C-methyl-D-erythritol 2,4-cyclodiphosphate synthase